MNRKLILTADFLDRLANSQFGVAINDGQAFLLATIEAGQSLGDEIDMTTLTVDDIDRLSSSGWLWLLENIKTNGHPPSIAFVDALFDSSTDPIFRLRIADAVLTHPSYEVEHGEWRGEAIEQLPESWPKRRLQSPIDSGSRADNLIEMTMICLQVANVTATAVLRALLKDRTAREIVQPIVDTVFAASGTSRTEWYQRLGLDG